MENYIVFKDKVLNVKKVRFANGQTCVVLENPKDTNSIYMKASLDLEDIPINNDQTIIKNYSENEGILECLIEHGIVSHTGL